MIDRRYSRRMRVAAGASLLLAYLVLSNGAHRLGFSCTTNLSLPQSVVVARDSDAIFSLLVSLQFSAAEHKEQFLQYIQPVSDHVKQHEPDTLAYEVLLSDIDPLRILVLERYRDKEVAYLKVHKSSEPFLAFRPKLQAMQEAGHVQISGHSYRDWAGLWS